jgi:hypothetical protein
VVKILKITEKLLNSKSKNYKFFKSFQTSKNLAFFEVLSLLQSNFYIFFCSKNTHFGFFLEFEISVDLNLKL